jgi:hypothetical protein
MRRQRACQRREAARPNLHDPARAIGQIFDDFGPGAAFERQLRHDMRNLKRRRYPATGADDFRRSRDAGDQARDFAIAPGPKVAKPLFFDFHGYSPNKKGRPMGWPLVKF